MIVEWVVNVSAQFELHIFSLSSGPKFLTFLEFHHQIGVCSGLIHIFDECFPIDPR